MSRRTSNSKWRLSIQEDGADYASRVLDSTEQCAHVLGVYTPDTGSAKAQMTRLNWNSFAQRFEPFAPAAPMLDVFEFEYNGGWRPIGENTLEWGLRSEVPWTATAAWGCRAIDRGHSIDVVHDRIDFIGCQERRDFLRGKLTLHLPIPELEKRVFEPPRTEEPFEIWDGDGMKVMARRSGGYVYVAAWLT